MSDLLPWMAPYTGWLVLATTMLMGIWLMRVGFTRERASGGPRCPKCDYDVSHSPTLTCSECGYTRKDPAEALRTRRQWDIAIIGLLLFISLPIFVIHRRVRVYGWEYYTRVGPLYWVLPDKVIDEYRHADYRIQILQDRRRLLNGSRYDDCRLVVKRRGVNVWSRSDWYIDAGSRSWSPEMADIQPIQDLDRDGTPEFIAELCGGGNSGAQLTVILSLGETLKDCNPHQPDDYDDGIRGFKDVDGDGRLDLIGADHVFVMWRTCHAGSPYPKVAFRLTNGRVEIAPDLMRTRELPLSADELAEARAQCLSAGWPVKVEDDLYSPLLRVMLDLIYSGHSQHAFAFLDSAWPGPQSEKQKFVQEFREQLVKSKFWPTIRSLGYPLIANLADDKK